MTDWKHWHNSKYAARCAYCGRNIHTSEGRWTAPREDGSGLKWVACHDCIAPPDAGKDASPPERPSGKPTEEVKGEVKPLPLPSLPPSIDICTPKASQHNAYTPESRIAKAHDDNMLSQELTRKTISALRDCVAEHMHVLVTHTHALDQLTAAMNERTRVLEEQLRKGADR